jgi:hypothetical protein
MIVRNIEWLQSRASRTEENTEKVAPGKNYGGTPKQIEERIFLLYPTQLSRK